LKADKFRWAPIIGTVLLSFVLWFITFYLTRGIFWVKISFSAAALAGLSLVLFPHLKERLRFFPGAIWLGLASAVVLYFIFWLGKVVCVAIFPFADSQIGGIYGIDKGTDTWVIALLLFFVTAPCEEIYWRGCLQENLMKRFGKWQGWLAATAVYALVHIWSFNFMLIGAAAVAGAFWGGMFCYFGNLLPVIISHAVWSSVIFAIFPVP